MTEANEEIRLTVNGESTTFRAVSSLAELLEALEVDPRGVAVERNREIVSREELAETPVAEGDTIEIVQFVGGG